MSLEIRKIDTSSRGDVRRFIELPWAIYRGCEQWVPPLVDDVKTMMNRRSYPFYQHSDADFFLAERDGRAVGRIAVLENRHYNDHWSSHTAFFYLFDAFDDAEAASGMFAAIEAWAGRRGLNKIVGAKGFLQGDGIGVLVEGFEHHPAVGIPYNHEYYGPLIEAAGYQRQRDFMSAYLPGNATLPPRLHQIAEKMMERRGFTIKTFESKKELTAWIPAIVDVYNQTFLENWEFNPITEAEGKVIGERLLSIADPKLIKLVMKGEEVIGFLFAFHDISAALQRIKGRLWPLGWLVLMREFKRTEWVNVNGIGLLPEHRGVGANAVLYTEMAKSVHAFGFKHADVVQIEDKNAKSRAEMAALGVQWYKTHRVYRRAV